jgi:hypothetical protein
VPSSSPFTTVKSPRRNRTHRPTLYFRKLVLRQTVWHCLRELRIKQWCIERKCYKQIKRHPHSENVCFFGENSLPRKRKTNNKRIHCATLPCCHGYFFSSYEFWLVSLCSITIETGVDLRPDWGWLLTFSEPSGAGSRTHSHRIKDHDDG